MLWTGLRFAPLPGGGPKHLRFALPAALPVPSSAFPFLSFPSHHFHPLPFSFFVPVPPYRTIFLHPFPLFSPIDVCRPMGAGVCWSTKGELVSWLEFNVPFQHKYGYIRDQRSQFIEDTVEPSVFLPGIISLVIMCIGII